MINTKYYYNGYSLLDEDGVITKIILSDVVKDPSIRNVSYPFANTHGSLIGPRIAESRLYSFEGYIVEPDAYIRETRRAELCSVFKIQSNINNPRFFPLNRRVKNGEPRTADCMVFDPLSATNGTCSPKVDWKFSLVAQDPRIYDPRVVRVVGGLAQMGAGPLWHILPYEEGDTFVGSLVCPNQGDWDAPMRLTVQGSVVNPKIFVFKDGEIKYQIKINGTTTDLVIDNTNQSASNSKDRFIVTDAGLDISGQIDTSDEISALFIPAKEYGQSPVSHVVVMADNYSEAVDSAVVNVSYRHTYSH